VEISLPEAATPITQLFPHPLMQHSKAYLITSTNPVASNEKSTPPSVKSIITC